MVFPEEPGGLSLPAPDGNRKYLLYLHVPFCTVLCPFCPFHRVKFREDVASRYFSALRKEIDRVSAAGYAFDELYIGGGTPTLLPSELVRTTAFLKERHRIPRMSVETNPDELEARRLQDLRQAGFGRLSVGVQSFDDLLLDEMQRLQKYGSGDDIRARLNGSKGIFDTLNVDMIFNFPHQTEASLRDDLVTLTDDIGIDQVSWYPLMSSADTQARMAPSMGRVDQAREHDFYELIAEHMLSRGYQRSSAWCFSRVAGAIDEYIVNRFEYVGLGSGAFSFLRGTLFASSFSISRYLTLINDGGTGPIGWLRLSERDHLRYFLLMRLFGGSLDRKDAESRFGGRFEFGKPGDEPRVPCQPHIPCSLEPAKHLIVVS